MTRLVPWALLALALALAGCARDTNTDRMATTQPAAMEVGAEADFSAESSLEEPGWETRGVSEGVECYPGTAGGMKFPKENCIRVLPGEDLQEVDISRARHSTSISTAFGVQRVGGASLLPRGPDLDDDEDEIEYELEEEDVGVDGDFELEEKIEFDD